ncbi:hypothetical protein D3C71_1330020 [compost metagenome]
MVFIVEFVVAQPLAGRRVGVEAEFGRKLGAAGAMADHAGVRAQAGQEAQRVDHQRFTGTGFARNNGHARPKLQLGGTDNSKILDRKMFEHGWQLVGPGKASMCAGQVNAEGASRRRIATHCLKT